jgi:hypothetical protein
VLIGLLLVALACLVLGLVLASAAWLIGSLVASVAAAFVLWQTRERIGAPSAAHTARAGTVPTDTTGSAAATTGSPATAASGSPATAATDAEPQLDQDYLARRAAWFAEGTRPGDVWVIDGRPDYHRPGCTQLTGTQAEPIPRSQALEDGFTPCGTCAPDRVTEVSLPADAVWVVDGRPRYHRADCMIISGRHAEAVPHAQASADGFMPCTLCEPDAARA